MNDDTDVPPRSSRQNPAYRPTSDTPALHSQRIQSDARQIHTRSVAPYCCAIRALCHPCRANTVVCFLWHFPGSHLRSPLAIILPQGARTFLSMADSSHAATICPTSDGGRLTANAEKANIFWFFASEANVEQGLARVVKKRVGRLCVWACV